MEFRQNKPLRSLGIYTLCDKTFILLKRSEELSFLFTTHNWRFHGPVDYRVSHGRIYCRGAPTAFTDEDLVDTGLCAQAQSLTTFAEGAKL